MFQVRFIKRPGKAQVFSQAEACRICSVQWKSSMSANLQTVGYREATFGIAALSKDTNNKKKKINKKAC